MDYAFLEILAHETYSRRLEVPATLSARAITSNFDRCVKFMQTTTTPQRPAHLSHASPCSVEPPLSLHRHPLLHLLLLYGGDLAGEAGGGHAETRGLADGCKPAVFVGLDALHLLSSDKLGGENRIHRGVELYLVSWFYLHPIQDMYWRNIPLALINFINLFFVHLNR